MVFQNPVVGGNTLIREAIQSPNYVPNVSGWTVNRDGSAEFNDLQARGGLQIGISPSPPNAYILGEVIAGEPTIAFYDGTNADPAKLTAYAAGPYGGAEIYTGSASGEEAITNWSGEAVRFWYRDNTGNQPFVTMSVGFLGPAIWRVFSGSNDPNENNMELGLDATIATPDGRTGAAYSVGEIMVAATKADANMPCRVIDGKAPGSLTTTVVGTSDTNISTANAQNVYLEDGYAYRATVNIDYANANTGGRVDFKLWDGTPGLGTQLGGTNRRWAIVNTSTNYHGTILVFLWKQVGTTLASNLNISALKSVVTAGTCNVQVNAAYSFIIEKLGKSTMIGGL